MSRNITILTGSVLDLQVYRNDSAATSVDFIMKNDDTDEVITVNAAYSSGIAQVEVDGLYTGVQGVYSYQINENTPDGIVKYGALNCVECEFGKVIICEALDGSVS